MQKSHCFTNTQRYCSAQIAINPLARKSILFIYHLSHSSARSIINLNY